MEEYADSFNIKMNKIFPQASSTFPQPKPLFPPKDLHMHIFFSHAYSFK